jgi:hypothetical protein
MKQIARNVAMEEWGFLCDQWYLIFDRDSNIASGEQASSAKALPKSTAW